MRICPIGPQAPTTRASRVERFWVGPRPPFRADRVEPGKAESAPIVSIVRFSKFARGHVEELAENMRAGDRFLRRRGEKRLPREMDDPGRPKTADRVSTSFRAVPNFFHGFVRISGTDCRSETWSFHLQAARLTSMLWERNLVTPLSNFLNPTIGIV